jgi:hypothetical protein
MKFTYPKLKEYCRKIGYEFQVVDMRWGIRDEATDDHMTTELCLNELKLCQKLSTGPNFVVSIFVFDENKQQQQNKIIKHKFNFKK